MPGQRLADKTERADIQRLANLGSRVPQPPPRAERPDKTGAGGVNVRVIDGEVFLAPGFELCRQRPVPVVEKRPIEKCSVGHLSCP